MAASKPHRLHIYFLPHMAPGHMIPLVDTARQFAAHGAKSTIILTHLNAPLFSQTIQRDTQLGHQISIRLIKFPSAQANLPENCENLASTTSSEMSHNFYKSLDLLQHPVEQLLEEEHPDCLVADLFFSWANEAAAKFNIPRLVFHGIGFFPLCVYQSLRTHEPYKNMKSNSETFIVPGLPDTIKLTRKLMPDHSIQGTDNQFTTIIDKVLKAEMMSYGVVVNSFHELEPAYSEHYKKVTGKKAWHVGPVSLCYGVNEDKAQRGQKGPVSQHDYCLSWLSTHGPNSVVYVCFGSMSLFSSAQLLEIAMGLEASGQKFIWVVKREKKNGEENEDWLPEGFEKRMEGKGLIIRGWGPQVLILDHESVGGFVTHCGWNSFLEGVSAGVPMVTWPLFAEQFYNEKLVTEVLRVGVAVGAQHWSKRTEEYKVWVKRKDIEKAVRKVMVGEEAEEMRSKATALADKAKKAVEEGGSSYTELNSLLEELSFNHP